MVAVLAGLAAGLIHVVSGPDHLAAVAPMAADDRQPQWRAGLQWGLGHTAVVIVIGVPLIWFRQLLPIDSISAISERLVGATLLMVAAWAFACARSPRPHVHASQAASFGMGALHGLAGSSHLFGVLPALAFSTPLPAALYLGSFGLGTIVAMTLFSTFIGVIAAWAARRGMNTHRGLLYACSFGAFLVGGFWLVR